MASIQNEIPSSTASTPGVPGAYHSKYDAGAKDANPAATLASVREYIPGQQDVKNSFSNVGETARQYLPQSVASYFPNNASTQKSQQDTIPHEASASSQPTESLPQINRSEDSAPKPVSHDSSSPLEPPQAAFAAMDTTSNFSGLSTEAQAGSSVGGPTPRDLTTTEGHSDKPQFSPMSSSVSNGGDAKESSDSPKLPPKDTELNEGQLDQPQATTTARVHPLAAKGTKWNPEDGDAAQPEKELPRAPQSQPSHTTSTKAHTGHSFEHTLNPSAHAQSNNSTLSNGSKFSEVPPSESSKSAQSNGSSGSGDSGSPRKSKFMDKVRGEAKILSGKLGKNEEKVEEGRRMMGKA